MYTLLKGNVCSLLYFIFLKYKKKLDRCDFSEFTKSSPQHVCVE